MRDNLAPQFLSLVLLWSPPAGGQVRGRGSQEPTAVVNVMAFEASGRFLGTPDISVFETNDHQNLAARFRNGTAVAIPYGVYRVEGRLPGFFPDIRYVRIYGPKAAVVLGLRFGGELPRVPPALSGRVVGLHGSTGKNFVRLSGVFENVSVESQIDDEGAFHLGGLSPGSFLLLVVGEKGILASKALTIPYTGPPIQMEIGRDQPVGRE